MFRALSVFTVWLALALPGARVALSEPGVERAALSDMAQAVEPSLAESTMVVPAGYRVELVAAEPLVRDPVAMEFDENGAAYVVELPPYNEHGKPGQKTHSSICRLEDTDGDGRFDKRSEFADDLNYCTGLFCYEGGVFVGDPPHLLYLRDTDGDGRADQREPILTGFGTAPAGESQLNSFRWGLDNRIHLCTGLDGGEIRPSGQPDAEPRNVRNRRLLLDPRTRTFELTSGGGQNGMSFDDWGHVFVCDNSQPVEEILYDNRYIERNPLMSGPEAKVNIGAGSDFARLHRISPPETWRRIRTSLRDSGTEVDDTYEPGRVSGIFTSATGITIYRGDAWPKEMRGTAFVGEVANNLVYAARLNSGALRTTSRRLDPDEEFMASTDTWFRPAQFAHGPDGNLYVIDMYRQLIEGVQWVPPQVLTHMDPTAGSDRGRIYRVVRNGFQQPPKVQMGQMSVAALVEQLEHRNGWHRDTAARLLYERQDQKAVEPLRRLLAGSSFPQARLHALGALDGLGALEADDVVRGLEDRHPRVREHAVRLSEDFLDEDASLAAKLIKMVEDPDVRVRFQLAFTLGCLPVAQRTPVLVEVIKRDGADSWFRMAVQSSLYDGAADFVRAMLADGDVWQAEHGQELLVALCRQIGRSGDAGAVKEVVAAVDALEAGDATDALAKKLVVSLLAEGTSVAAADLTDCSSGRCGRTVRDLLTTARDTALDTAKPDESRVEAIAMLGCGSFAAERTSFEELLAPQQTQAIQQAVLQTLRRFADGGVVELLLSKWPGFTPGMRSSAAEVLLSRQAWAESLLTAVENKEVASSDFDPARVMLLKSHPLATIRERADSVFAKSTIERRADVVANYETALEIEGDVERGRGVFKKSCSACHVLEGSGTPIGADLRSIRDRGPEAILLNILDPNREIQPNFLTYTIITSDGSVLTGIVTQETPNNLVIRQADGTVVDISRAEIDEMRSTGLSYMPEGLEKEIDVRAMADLLSYLMSDVSGAVSAVQDRGSEE